MLVIVDITTHCIINSNLGFGWLVSSSKKFLRCVRWLYTRQ